MTTHDYTNLFFATCSTLEICVEKSSRCWQDLKVFAICPQGFALAYGKNLREFWKRCWHRPGPFSWGSVEYDSSANSEMRHYFLTLEVSWSFMKFRFFLSFSTKSYWRVPAIEHIEPGAMFLCPRSWVCTWTCCKTTALDRVMCIT